MGITSAELVLGAGLAFKEEMVPFTEAPSKGPQPREFLT